MTTKSKNRLAKDRCDRLFSKIVRSVRRCDRCGEDEYRKLQCAHIVRRNHSTTRTDLRNAWCLCGKCHWATEKEAEAFMDLVDQTIGRDMLEELRTEAREGVGVKFDWLTEEQRLKKLHRAIELDAPRVAGGLAPEPRTP